jgi:hypothetical protein
MRGAWREDAAIVRRVLKADIFLENEYNYFI